MKEGESGSAISRPVTLDKSHFVSELRLSNCREADNISSYAMELLQKHIPI